MRLETLWILGLYVTSGQGGGKFDSNSSGIFFFQSQKEFKVPDPIKTFTNKADGLEYAQFYSLQQSDLANLSPARLSSSRHKGWKRGKEFVQAEIWIESALLESSALNLIFAHMSTVSAKFGGSTFRTRKYSHHFIYLHGTANPNEGSTHGIRIDFDPRDRNFTDNPLIEISRHEFEPSNKEEKLTDEKLDAALSFRSVLKILFHASYPKYYFLQSVVGASNNGHANCQTISKQLQQKLKTTAQYMKLANEDKLRCKYCKGKLACKHFSYSRDTETKCDVCKESCVKKESPTFTCEALGCSAYRSMCLDCIKKDRISPKKKSGRCCNKKNNRILELTNDHDQD